MVRLKTFTLLGHNRLAPLDGYFDVSQKVTPLWKGFHLDDKATIAILEG